MWVAHGLEQDIRNPPYIALGNAMFANILAKAMELHDA